MEIDLPAAAEAEASEQPVPAQQYALNILQIIRSAQQQNGLKHGDYGRYRQYCARRLRSLYKSLKFLHGKSRYTKKKLDAAMINDVRYLHIPLVSAERGWSYAMELKKEAEGKSAPRKHLHSTKRLAKAAYWAAELSQFASQRCDTRSALEAEAYSSWMGGNLLLEKESDWEGALARYARAKKLFSELAKVGDLDSQALCSSMVEEIEPSLRYCHYQISRAGGAAPDVQQLLELGEGAGEDGAGHPGLDMLQSKLAALQAEAQSAQAASTSSLEWRGHTHPARHEPVRLALHAAAELAAQIDTAMDIDGQEQEGRGTSTSGVESKLALYDKLVNAYSSARSAVRSAIKANSSGEGAEGSSGGAAEELAGLEVAVRGVLLERSLARAQLAVDDAVGRFEAGQARLAAGKAAKGKDGRVPKPEDIVRLHDSLLHYTEELSELSTSLGGRQGEALSDACAARAAVYTAGRCLYVAHAYLAGDKHGEACALFERAQSRVAEAEEKLQDLPRGEPLVAEATSTLQTLKAKAAAYRLVAQAEATAEAAGSREEAAKGMGALGLGAPATAATAAAGGAAPCYLAEHLDAWEAFCGSGFSTDGKPGKGVRVFSAPYPPQPAPLRPIMLDTAAAHLAYPTLEHRVRKASATGAAKSTFSRLFGGWGTAAK